MTCDFYQECFSIVLAMVCTLL